MKSVRVLGVVSLLLALCAPARASIPARPEAAALQRLQGERDRLELLKQKAGNRPPPRTTWYLTRLTAGLDGAREMLRSLIAPGLADRARPAPRAQATHKLAGRRILLDAGHGGTDPGATGIYRKSGVEQFRLREKELTLDVTQLLAARLRAAGADVVLTRTSDETLDLFGRGAFARTVDADLFMSIHFNYSVLSEPTRGGGRAVDGIDYTTVYLFAPTRKNLPMPGYADRLAECLENDQPAASAQLADLVFRRLSSALGLLESPPPAVRQRMRTEEARRARLSRKARQLDVEFPITVPPAPGGSPETPTRGQIALLDRFFARYPQASLPTGVRRSDFVVLREIPDKPAVLVETCFIGDRTELSKLKGDGRRATIVDALYKAICDYAVTPASPL